MVRRMRFSVVFIGLVLMLVLTGTAAADQPERLEGVMSVLLSDDFQRGNYETIHELVPEDGGLPYALRFSGPAPDDLRTGQRVRVEGTTLPGRRLGVEEITVLDVGGQGGGGGGGGKGGGGKAARSSAVLLINLTDADALLTRAQAEDMMWGSTNSTQDIYLQDSRGKTDFVRDSDGDGQADVYGPYDVAMAGAGSCSYRSWSNAARVLAEADGVNLSNRDHYIYVITGHNNNGCSFGGTAELGGDESWINFDHAFVFMHELGHNLNMHHAGSDPDNDGVLNSAYGDGSCFMGASYRYIFLNAPHKEQLGYLTASGGAIQEVSTSPGLYRYRLAPLAWDSGDTADPQIVKIPRPDLGRYYYLSLRDDSSYDANLYASYTSGVSVHWYNPDDPATVTGYVTTLSDGQSFTDLVNGITVTQVARAGDGSWVDVDVQIDASFEVSTPGFDLRPFSGQLLGNTVGPNDDAVYIATLTNNDGPGTPPSTWSLSTRNLPAGMIATFDPSSVVLGPGESAAVALTVNPNGAADGLSVFYVDATDDDGVAPHHLIVDDYGRLTVDGVSPRPDPPTGLTGSANTSKGKLYVSLDWEASPSTDVSGYRVFIDEQPVPRYWRSSAATSLSTRWTLDPGTYTFTVAAESSSGRLSLLSGPATVTIAKGGGN